MNDTTDYSSVGKKPTTTPDTTTTTVVAYGDPRVQAAVDHLESHWEIIWAEYQAVAPNLASDYMHTDKGAEHGKQLHQGGWDWHSYMTKGQVAIPNAHSTNKNRTALTCFATNFPETTRILSHFRHSDDKQLFEGTPFGYAFFSTLHGSSKIAPHTAPMNLRLRIHLALSVPNNNTSSSVVETDADSGATDGASRPRRPDCGICIGGLTRTWQMGKCLVIDDAYEHKVWNDTTEPRVLLLVDIWHPDILATERHDIVSMFAAVKQKGWLQKE